MDEAQVRTVEQVRQVLAGTQELQFRAAQDDEGRYGWIESVLRRLGYRQLGRADRGTVLAYLQRLSGYSRAQVTRLVARWMADKRLAKNYRAPEHAFARRYTAADVALLAEVDRAMGTLSGPATACVLRRQRDVSVRASPSLDGSSLFSDVQHVPQRAVGHAPSGAAVGGVDARGLGIAAGDDAHMHLQVAVGERDPLAPLEVRTRWLRRAR